MFKRKRRTERPEKSKRKKQRTWPVGWTSLLLLLQSLSLGALAYHDIPFRYTWPARTLYQVTELIELFFSATLYAVLAVVTLLTAVAFFRLARSAWLMALGVQGVVLSIALVLYTHSRPPYLYLLMVFSIYMVINLHYYEVQLPFQPETEEEAA